MVGLVVRMALAEAAGLDCLRVNGDVASSCLKCPVAEEVLLRGSGEEETDRQKCLPAAVEEEGIDG